VDIKTPLEIHCNTTETGIRMEWEKDGENITVPKDNRIKIADNKLVIEETKSEDLGNYSCRIFKQDVKTGEQNIVVIGKSTISFAFTKFSFVLLLIYYYYYYYY
jgi:Ca2+-dependent lipid-binding protein